jgi:hypothetical protein
VLPAPDDPTPWLAAWTDTDAARIGFASGIVYSLPTRVPLSDPLPDGSMVSAYLHVCATTFALGGDAVYRLTPSPSSPKGAWVSVMAEASLPALPSLSGGSLFWGDSALVAFSLYGESWRLPIASGCP